MKAILAAATLCLAASCAAAQPDCRVSLANHRSIENAKVRDDLGALAMYYDHFPCERIGGKTIYELMRPLFVYVAGTKTWRRLLTYSVETPLAIHTGADEDSYLVVMLCKPRSCSGDRAAILMLSEDFGAAGRQLGLAGICFYRRAPQQTHRAVQSSHRYDIYADGIAVHARTRVPIEPEGEQVDQCSARQILARVHEFYPPE